MSGDFTIRHGGRTDRLIGGESPGGRRTAAGPGHRKYRMTPAVPGNRAYKLEVIHMASRTARKATIWIIVALVIAGVVIGIVVTAGDGGVGGGY